MHNFLSNILFFFDLGLMNMLKAVVLVDFFEIFVLILVRFVS